MENATKALLIAAAVLVVILLIAFGMRIMQSTGDSSQQITNTSQQMTTQGNTALNAISNSFQGLDWLNP